jgi:hypothetical protein
MPETSGPVTVLLDITYNGSEIYVGTDGSIEAFGEEVTSYNEYKAAFNNYQSRK